MDAILQDGDIVELDGRVVEGYERATFLRFEPTLVVGICPKRICFWKKKDPFHEKYHWGGEVNVGVHDKVLRLGVCLPVQSDILRDQMIASLEMFLAELRLGAGSSTFTIASDYSGNYDRPAA
ncbi:MAG TPA: hypothetical protein VJC11_03170 [Patescibacteria group bacterium]|nr:hypothetical protein [Patescibacteria group bacterium]